jgi:hypothetical protein
VIKASASKPAWLKVTFDTHDSNDVKLGYAQYVYKARAASPSTKRSL